MKRGRNSWWFVVCGLSFILGNEKSFSQNNQTAFWKLLSLSGEVKAKGLYRERETIRQNISEIQTTDFYSGGLQLNTRSFFWHPNFVIVDVNGEVNPQSIRDKYLLSPNFSEVNTLGKMDFRTTFFREKPITVNTFANIDESYSKRENLSDLKTSGRNFGGNLIYGNKFLPLSVSYSQLKREQQEILTNRSFTYQQKNFESSVTKSFSATDRNELRYLHNDFVSGDVNLFPVKNISDNLYLNNSFYFDKKQKQKFSSVISGTLQAGSDSFQRVQAYENLTLKFPKKFFLNGGYDFYNIQRSTQTFQKHGATGMFGHQLFESLFTDIFYEYNYTKHTVYQLQNNKQGFDVRYEKKLPLKSRLSLSYKYFTQNFKTESNNASLQIIREEYVLTDGKLVLLAKPYITISSAVVKDETGTKIYQLNLDYLLITRDNFIEIQRVPGGQIANNGRVYIDYTAIQPGDYQYALDYNYFSASILLFGKLLEVYYRTSEQDNFQLQNTEFLVLNYFTQNIYGSRVEYKFVSGGAEWDDYQSNIIPYRMVRYYLTVQGSYRQKLLCSINGNISEYQLTKTDFKREFADVTGNITYWFRPQTKINLQLGYQHQNENELQLDLLMARSEFTTHWKQLFFTIGLEIYRRDFSSEKINFNGASLQISRKF